MTARLTALLALLLLALPGAATVHAQGAGGEADAIEVRVAARRLLNGKTEFAAQQRLADGTWGERRLPRARFFPASTRVGRWLASSPLIMSASQGAGVAEIRVAAQRLADGRMEFAAQQRGADGEWDERLLPRARFFPASPGVDRWLVSTPLTVTPPTADSLASDRAALVALYEATDGPNWTNSTNWLSDKPLGEWYGITLYRDRVWSLDVRRNGLSGQIPAELRQLTGLNFLHLAGNQLSGPIPAELGDLTRLISLDLELNALSGQIPAELGNLRRLIWLDLGLNELSGPIPPELGRLTYLSSLTLRSNRLRGPIPAELGSFAYLEFLNLGDNDLSGAIPPELGRLTRLVFMRLSGNRLSGQIPGELGALTELGVLELEANELSGPIPAELGDLPNLTALHLSGNRLTGCIPRTLRDTEDTDFWQLDLPYCD